MLTNFLFSIQLYKINECKKKLFIKLTEKTPFIVSFLMRTTPALHNHFCSKNVYKFLPVDSNVVFTSKTVKSTVSKIQLK